VGWFTWKPTMKEVKAPAKIISFEIGIASSASKLKIINKTGMIKPPPPIPPAFENNAHINKSTNPIISLVCIGNSFLWTQLFFVSHILKSGQSLSKWQCHSHF